MEIISAGECPEEMEPIELKGAFDCPCPRILAPVCGEDGIDYGFVLIFVFLVFKIFLK